MKKQTVIDLMNEVLAENYGITFCARWIMKQVNLLSKEYDNMGYASKDEIEEGVNSLIEQNRVKQVGFDSYIINEDSDFIENDEDEQKHEQEFKDFFIQFNINVYLK